jgi:hypothetical protein
MKIRNRWTVTLFIAGLTALVSLACGTGYSFTSRHFGNTGQVVVRNESIEETGTIQVEINEDYSWDEVALDITVAVESGDLQAIFTDDNGQSLSLSAAAGQPASGHVEMETDATGDIDLQLTGAGARGVTITIDYTRK